MRASYNPHFSAAGMWAARTRRCDIAKCVDLILSRCYVIGRLYPDLETHFPDEICALHSVIQYRRNSGRGVSDVAATCTSAESPSRRYQETDRSIDATRVDKKSY